MLKARMTLQRTSDVADLAGRTRINHTIQLLQASFDAAEERLRQIVATNCGHRNEFVFQTWTRRCPGGLPGCQGH